MINFILRFIEIRVYMFDCDAEEIFINYLLIPSFNLYFEVDPT